MSKTILRLLEARSAGKTICPSEAARAAAGSDVRSTWEPLMDKAREAAFALADVGQIVITQKGRIIEGRTAKGPIRLRLK
jgi:Protein of unknown function (DUF3253)